MSCSIDDRLETWKITPNHVNELIKHLYESNENAGEIIINSRISKQVIVTHLGDKDSVGSPDSILNWHSHPISCYKQEKTVWGWASGEDMRESIIYGLRGSACHFIPSIEGLYTIQVNPCAVLNLLEIETFVDKYKYPKLTKYYNNWGDFLRGFIILSIEIYFRSSHIFRTLEYINSNPDITANDFIKFCNSFELSNLFTDKNVDGCGLIKCNSIHTYEKNKMKQISYANYVNSYESGNDTTLYLISKDGNNIVTSTKYITILKKGGIDILKSVVLGKSCNFPDIKSSKIFQVKLHPNYTNGKKYIDMSLNEKIRFINGSKHLIEYKGGNIEIKMLKVSGSCKHTDLKKYLYGKTRSLIIIGSDKCRFCTDANEKAKKMNNINYKYVSFDSIREAIEYARKNYDPSVMTIPVYILNGKVEKNLRL